MSKPDTFIEDMRKLREEMAPYFNADPTVEILEKRYKAIMEVAVAASQYRKSQKMWAEFNHPFLLPDMMNRETELDAAIANAKKIRALT